MLKAYAGTDDTGVLLATVAVKVLNAPDPTKVTLKNGNSDFDYTVTLSGTATVTVVPESGASATYTLTSTSSLVEVKESGRNTWTIKAKNTAKSKDLFTITLKDAANGFLKNYTVTVQ